jgi:hypothetical protein
MSDDKKNDDIESSEDYDLSVEKLVAPEENIDWLPHPTPSAGEAPAP